MGWLDWLIGRKRGEPRPAEVRQRLLDDLDDDPVPSWTTTDVPYGPATRQKGMVVMAGTHDTTIAGTQFRAHACADFARAADRALAKSTGHPNLELHRKRNNAADPNAIEVWGCIANVGRWHIGHVRAAHAAEIASRWSPEMPLGAELRRYGNHVENGQMFFSMNILIPNASNRKKYEIPPN